MATKRTKKRTKRSGKSRAKAKFLPDRLTEKMGIDGEYILLREFLSPRVDRSASELLSEIRKTLRTNHGQFARIIVSESEYQDLLRRQGELGSPYFLLPEFVLSSKWQITTVRLLVVSATYKAPKPKKIIFVDTQKDAVALQKERQATNPKRIVEVTQESTNNKFKVAEWDLKDFLEARFPHFQPAELMHDLIRFYEERERQNEIRHRINIHNGEPNRLKAARLHDEIRTVYAELRMLAEHKSTKKGHFQKYTVHPDLKKRGVSTSLSTIITATKGME